MDKSIDLGKLQSELKQAHAACKSARVVLDSAYTKADNAAQALENAKNKHKAAVEAVDKARRLMVEAARTVANG